MIRTDYTSTPQRTIKLSIQKVLLVEDSPTQALCLKTLLEAEGMTVIVAGDGPEALERAQKQTFDLIVLDIELPTLNGFDTLRRLKLGPETANIPVILFTGRDRPFDTLTGLKLGIIDYIPKDAFAEATLMNTIHHLNKGDTQ